MLILILTSLGIYFAMKSERTDISSTTNSAPTNIINTKLDLSDKGLTKIPEYIFSENQLEELNLSNNQITRSKKNYLLSLTSL